LGFPIHTPLLLHINVEEPWSREFAKQETIAMEPNELFVIVTLPFSTLSVSLQVISV